MKNTYGFICSCGKVIMAGARSREEAVEKLKTLMSEEEVARHRREAHTLFTPVSKQDMDRIIERKTVEF
jgi:hypothetical protein